MYALYYTDFETYCKIMDYVILQDNEKRSFVVERLHWLILKRTEQQYKNIIITGRFHSLEKKFNTSHCARDILHKVHYI